MLMFLPTAAFTESTWATNALLLAVLTFTVPAARAPPTSAETVEVSLVLPTAASPAITPPLPAVLAASFSSVPVGSSSSGRTCCEIDALSVRKRRVVSRSELVEHLYDQDFDRDSNTIEVFVGRVRKKLGVDVIQTVRGLGYMLAPPGNAS